MDNVFSRILLSLLGIISMRNKKRSWLFQQHYHSLVVISGLAQSDHIKRDLGTVTGLPYFDRKKLMAHRLRGTRDPCRELQ